MSAASVLCSRCGQRPPDLAEAPLPGPWGIAVRQEVCGACWQEWLEEQTRLINHEGLQTWRPADRARLYGHLHAFLHLSSIAAPPAS